MSFYAFEHYFTSVSIFLLPGDPHSGRFQGQRPLSRQPNGRTKPQSNSELASVPGNLILMAQENYSSWPGDSWFHTSHLFSLTSPYSCIRGLERTFKRPTPLGLVIVRHAESSYLDWTTLLGHRTAAENHRSKTAEAFQLCSSTLGSDRTLVWEICFLGQFSSLPEHILFLFQSTGSLVCTFHFTHNATAAISTS